MNAKIMCFAFLFGALALFSSLTGCSKSGANASGGLDPAKVSTVVKSAFAQSSEDTKQKAAGYVEAFQGQNPAAAFVELQKLRAQPDLTPKQRAVVAKAMQTSFKQLQAAAQSGNATAQSVMHQYVSSR